MAEQGLYEASAGWLDGVIGRLRRDGVQVLGPVRSEPDLIRLAPVESGEGLALEEGKTKLPLKELFLPMTEVLLEFDKREGGDVDVRSEPLPDKGEVAVVGCRPCDAAALEALDKLFQWDYDDVRYGARRRRTTLVSFACTKAEAECFCTSVGGSPHGDRMTDVLVYPGEDGGALLRVQGAKGERFIERAGELVRPAAKGKEPPPPPELKAAFDTEKVKSWLDGNFESEFWTERAMRCLGCGVCSYLCPTCHCFDIVDEGTWNHGQRRRNWDHCSHAQFTLHASGHNPRPDHAGRYRQRVMHKFKYFPERFGLIGCVGCGRCIKGCGAGQNLRAALAELGPR